MVGAMKCALEKPDDNCANEDKGGAERNEIQIADM